MKALDIPIQAEPTFQEISQVPIESKTINSTLEINSTLNPTSEVALTLSKHRKFNRLLKYAQVYMVLLF